MTSASEHHAIVPRRVSFDWSHTPLHWIPDEPTATHVINVLHLLLPAGERWFVKVFKEGLPSTPTQPLPRWSEHRIVGLQGGGHVQLASLMRSDRPNTTPAFGPLSHQSDGSGLPKRYWPCAANPVVRDPARSKADHGQDPCRCAAAKAGDQRTQDRSECAGDQTRVCHRQGTVHGPGGPSRAMNCPRTPGGSRAGRSPRHRSYTCRRGGAAQQILHDPQLAGRVRYSLAEHNKAVRKGLLPTWQSLGAAVPRYLRRSYHPSREGSLSRAVEYLRRSPAARAGAA
ncbi:metal-dependent hydrolase [Streptomyces sp. NPDC050508]|uniref:metal-dependent hydrolase n=1 Tax=Streptomyces sp. NPDC050508 TaxID=3155405 RepID=UPI00343A471E